MSKVGKKASIKAIEYAQKIIDGNQLDDAAIEYAGQKLGKSTSWEVCYNIIFSGFQIDIHTKCERTGNSTEIVIYKNPGEKEDLIEKLSYPNELAFDEKEMDWEWNFIYKQVCEWMMKNSKKLGKSKKQKSKDIEISTEELMVRVAQLHKDIKTASAKAKKKLIDQYNKLSKILNIRMEEKEKEVKAKIEQNKASEDELEALRKHKIHLMNKIRHDTAKGRPVDHLKKELAEVAMELKEKKLGRRSI